MLGTLILVSLLLTKSEAFLLRLQLSLISDNQGNIFALLNSHTRKMPTAAFLMQLAGNATQVIYEKPAQANSNANPAPKKVLSKITIEKVKTSQVSSDPQKVTVSAAFALCGSQCPRSKNCLLPRDAKEENWANLDFYHHSASQRQLGQGDDSQRWWNMVNNAVTELL
eukprot:s836_g14.t1